MGFEGRRLTKAGRSLGKGSRREENDVLSPEVKEDNQFGKVCLCAQNMGPDKDEGFLKINEQILFLAVCWVFVAAQGLSLVAASGAPAHCCVRVQASHMVALLAGHGL